MSEQVLVRINREASQGLELTTLRREKLRKKFEDKSYWTFIKKGPLGLTICAMLTYPRVLFNHIVMEKTLDSRLTIYQETFLRTLKWSSNSSLKTIRKTASFMEFLIKTRCSEPFQPIEIDKGIKGYWLGPVRHKQKESEATILYLHGGGYVAFSSLVGIIPLCYLLKTLRKRYNKHIRVLAIDYDLAPEHPFPDGLNCAERSYKWLINSDIAGSKKVFLCGDSAGGGLALGLLQKLYPDDNTAKVNILPLGAILISPWVDLSCDALSFFTNAKFDWLPELYESAAESYVFGEKGNPERKRIQNETDIIMEWLAKVEDAFDLAEIENSSTIDELNKRLSNCSEKTRKRISQIRDSFTEGLKKNSLTGLKEIGNQSENPFINPLISPLHIPHHILSKFPSLFISYGGKELFKDDIEIFIQKCIESKRVYSPALRSNYTSSISVDTLFDTSDLNINNSLDGQHPDVMVEMDEDMVHDYPILIDGFGKHSRRALDRMAYFIANRMPEPLSNLPVPTLPIRIQRPKNNYKVRKSLKTQSLIEAASIYTFDSKPITMLQNNIAPNSRKVPLVANDINHVNNVITTIIE